MIEPSDRAKRKHLPMIGFALSAIYAAGVAAYLIATGMNPAELRLNELGDFLGGVSSPLAFLWLVLGFFQQGREIRLSNRALHLQAEEMRASIDQQNKLMEHSARDGSREKPGETQSVPSGGDIRPEAPATMG